MDIELSFYPQALLLVITRIAGVTSGTVIFGKALAPMKVRILLAFAIAMVFTPLIPDEWARTAVAMDSMPKMMMGMLGELLLGFTIALVCEMFVGVFMITGFVMGWASSLMMSKTMDPVSGIQNNVMGLLLQLVFLMLIWSHGGHLILLQILFKSFFTVPPTFAWLSNEIPELMVALGQLMFEWGIKMAAPVIAAGLVINAGMGLVSKMAPQFNVLFLSMPIRLGAGMMMMGLFLRYGSGQMREVIKVMLEYCLKVVL